MRISDWSSDVCSSDLASSLRRRVGSIVVLVGVRAVHQPVDGVHQVGVADDRGLAQRHGRRVQEAVCEGVGEEVEHRLGRMAGGQLLLRARQHLGRSEEHTSELQSLMRITYAVFCLKKNNMQIYN